MNAQHQRPNPIIPDAERVPLREKFALGASQISFQYAVSNLHTPIFVNVLGLSPGWLGTFSLIERIWDAVTDALMGWVTDRSQSRWGRRKPFILIGGILSALFLPVTYLVNPGWSDVGKAAWLLSCMLLLALFFTIWNIPIQCTVLESTPNSVERTNVAVWRGYAGKIGWLGIAWTWWLVQLPVFADVGGKVNMLRGAVWVFSIMGVIGVVLALFPLIVKNRVGTGATDKRSTATQYSLRENLRLTFRNRPFVILLFFTLFFTLGYNLKLGLEFQTRLMYVFRGDTVQASYVAAWGHSLSLVCGIIGIPIFQRLSRIRGKGYALAWVMGVVFFAGASTVICYDPRWPWFSIIPTIIMAPANTAFWILLPSMTGDAVDYDETQTGERREGSYAATYSWFMKAAQSLANFGGGWVLVFAGFNSKLPLQTPEVVTTMRVLLVALPVVFIAAAIWLIAKYPLTQARIDEIHAELETRRLGGGRTIASA